MTAQNAQAASSMSTYYPSAFFTSDVQQRDRVLLILNQPLSSRETLDRLWRSSSYHFCADGGANQLYDLMLNEGKEKGEDIRQRYLPDIIHGDLDSLRSDVHSFYAGAGVSVSRDPDQYSTDFGKAISKITSGRAQAELEVVILGSISGRVDQGLGVLHELARERERHPRLRLFLVSEQSVSFLLAGGYERSVIVLRAHGVADEEPQGPAFTKKAGIIPLYGVARIWTKGFEWDVQDWETRMGGDVSTSNHIVSGTVEVVSSERVLFTVQRRAALPPLDT